MERKDGLLRSYLATKEMMRTETMDKIQSLCVTFLSNVPSPALDF